MGAKGRRGSHFLGGGSKGTKVTQLMGRVGLAQMGKWDPQCLGTQTLLDPSTEPPSPEPTQPLLPCLSSLPYCLTLSFIPHGTMTGLPSQIRMLSPAAATLPLTAAPSFSLLSVLKVSLWVARSPWAHLSVLWGLCFVPRWLSVIAT